MSNAAHDHLNALAQQAAYQARFRYKDEPRTSQSVDDISLSQLGHMIDTLKDATLLIRHIDAEPKLDATKDRVYEQFDQQGLPAYVTRIASDFRLAHTYNRADTGRLPEVKRHPDLSAFLNLVHAMMRQGSLNIGRTFCVPESCREDVEAYDALVKRYETMLKEHATPESGKPDYKRIPEDRMKAFAADFEPLADRLYANLMRLPSVEVLIEGKRHSLPNTQPLNDRLRHTYPALVLFAFRTLGRGAADKNKRPAALEYDARQRELIGAQSMITDTTQALFAHAKAHGVTFPESDIDREKLREWVTSYARSFQLMLAACETADCSYPMMMDDLRRFIRMGAGDTQLHTLQAPEEAALMLYAVERRFAREGEEGGLSKSLRAYADKLGSEPDMATAQNKYGDDIAFQRELQRATEMAQKKNWGTAVTALQQLKESLPYHRNPANRPAAEECRGYA